MKRILLIAAAALAVTACNNAPVDPAANAAEVNIPALMAKGQAESGWTDAAGRNAAEVDRHSSRVHDRQLADAKVSGTLSYDADQSCTDHKSMVARLSAEGLKFDHQDGSMDVYTGNGQSVQVVSAGGQDCVS